MEQVDGFIDATAMLRPCVYALLHHGRVVYIGQSKKPLTRVYAHRSLWGRKKPRFITNSAKGILFDEVWLKPCRVEDLERIEGDLILKYKPIYNERSGAYTKVPEEMVGIVARIIARKAVPSDTATLIDPVLRAQMAINRRGF